MSAYDQQPYIEALTYATRSVPDCMDASASDVVRRYIASELKGQGSGVIITSAHIRDCWKQMGDIRRFLLVHKVPFGEQLSLFESAGVRDLCYICT